ncbi:MAG: hypothetical protein JJ913_07105 [Rhizobiaceae bacterium]|nr:hypothetical protein [Rhizobiaceae bacterium]
MTLMAVLACPGGALADLRFHTTTLDRDVPVLLVEGDFASRDSLDGFVSAFRRSSASTVVFDSPGGSVTKAIELGRLIRTLGLNTAQVRSRECASACALAFMGGVKRSAEPGSIGVHRSSFVGGHGLATDDAVSVMQQVTGEVIAFMSEMGVDPVLLQLALRYDSTDIRYLSMSEMEQYRLVTGTSAPAEPRTASRNPAKPTVAPPLPAAKPARPMDAASLAALEQGLKDAGFDIFEALKEELPDIYDRFMGEIGGVIEGRATQEQASRRGFELMVRVRRDNAERLLAAPDDALLQMLRSQITLLSLVESRETPRKCAEFAIAGAEAIDEPDRLYRIAFDEAATTLVRAIGASSRWPRPVSAARDEDWVALRELYLERGGTDEELQSLAELDPGNPRLCETSVEFYEAVMALPGPPGRRIRAEIARDIAAS